MRVTARRVVFIVVAAYMLLGPSAVQYFGQKGAPWPRWKMFHRRGTGICAVRFFQDERRLDRYAVLGVPRRKAPREFRRITSEEQARKIGKQLCDLLGEGTDLRVELRCADMEGFHPVLDREENLCLPR